MSTVDRNSINADYQCKTTLVAFCTDSLLNQIKIKNANIRFTNCTFIKLKKNSLVLFKTFDC